MALLAEARRGPRQGTALTKAAAPAAAPGPQLRPAVPDDALCLGVLATQVWLDTYATQGIRPLIAREVLASFGTAAMAALLARPGTQVHVAEAEGHLLGFAQTTLGTPQPLVDTPAPAELDRLYVQEPFTRHGLGRRLLQAAEGWAAGQGASGLWLTPWVHNHRARAFYAAQGYADVGATLFTMEGEPHENRVLWRALPR